MTVRVPLQMQNLDSFGEMAAVIPQFLQHNVQYNAGVTTPSRSGPDDMEVDALTKRGNGHNGHGKPTHGVDGQTTSCFTCGRAGHLSKACWFKGTNKGSGRNSH